MIVRRQQLGVGVLDGKAYAVGGSDGSLRLSSVECFDPSTNFWSFVAPMSTCRSGVGVGVLGGAMYAAGGYDGSLLPQHCWSGLILTRTFGVLLPR